MRRGVADEDVEAADALEDLAGHAAAHGGRDHALDVFDVDAVAGDRVAVDTDEKLRCARDLVDLYVGRAADVVPSAIEYLISEQDPATGAWVPAVLTAGTLDNEARPVWTSRSATTAMVLQALCRRRLAADGF